MSMPGDLVDAGRIAAFRNASAAQADAERIRYGADMLDQYGWHRDDCPAYDQANDGELASEADNRKVECACGFRQALDLLVN